MNVITPSSQHQRKANGNNNNNNNPIIEQKWIWCDLLATMMQSKTNDENFVILVVEIIGYRTKINRIFDHRKRMLIKISFCLLLPSIACTNASIRVFPQQRSDYYCLDRIWSI